jgi:hypothetical protein
MGDFVFGSMSRRPVTATQIPSQFKGGQNVKSALTSRTEGRKTRFYISADPLSLQPGLKSARIYGYFIAITILDIVHLYFV